MSSEKQLLDQWEQYRKNVADSTPIDLNESKADQLKRIRQLEADHEAWFKYYFPSYYKYGPAPFHLKSTKRVMENPEWTEQRIWARELSKSGRTMMEVMKLALTKKKRCIIMASATLDSAVDLLAPYKINFETNNRIINDYGTQKNIGQWETDAFVTSAGVAFYAFGAGQSPRGKRNEAIRPDVQIIDDMDTDEKCRNPERVKADVDWINEALYGTRSISEPLLRIINGNLIAKYSVVSEMKKVADHSEVVNIRDKNGKSTWPQKNTEEMIDRVLSKTTYRAAQKEYFNNPIVEGTTFKTINYGKVPPMAKCESVIVYCDPATADNKNKTSSMKCVAIIGKIGFQYYVYRIWLDHAKIRTFVQWMYEAYRVLDQNKVDVKRIYIENNTLQNPFYEQVIKPMIKEMNRETGIYLPILPDARKKGEKFDRVEGTLEPIHNDDNLIFDERIKDSKHMERFEDQWYSVAPGSKTMDGPDTVEGGVSMIKNRMVVDDSTTYRYGKRESRKY